MSVWRVTTIFILNFLLGNRRTRTRRSVWQRREKGKQIPYMEMLTRGVVCFEGVFLASASEYLGRLTSVEEEEEEQEKSCSREYPVFMTSLWSIANILLCEKKIAFLFLASADNIRTSFSFSSSSCLWLVINSCVWRSLMNNSILYHLVSLNI